MNRNINAIVLGELKRCGAQIDFNDSIADMIIEICMGGQTNTKREITMYDCGFTKKNNWFCYRAAAIIIENDCVLFVGNELEGYYYSVGGAVKIRETAE